MILVKLLACSTKSRLARQPRSFSPRRNGLAAIRSSATRQPSRPPHSASLAFIRARRASGIRCTRGRSRRSASVFQASTACNTSSGAGGGIGGVPFWSLESDSGFWSRARRWSFRATVRSTVRARFVERFVPRFVSRSCAIRWLTADLCAARSSSEAARWLIQPSSVSCQNSDKTVAIAACSSSVCAPIMRARRTGSAGSGRAVA